MENKQQPIQYYGTRLEVLLNLWIYGNKKIIEENKDKVEFLVEGYKQFGGQKGYDAALPVLVETFLLNKYSTK